MSTPTDNEKPTGYYAKYMENRQNPDSSPPPDDSYYHLYRPKSSTGGVAGADDEPEKNVIFRPRDSGAPTAPGFAAGTLRDKNSGAQSKGGSLPTSSTEGVVGGDDKPETRPLFRVREPGAPLTPGYVEGTLRFTTLSTKSKGGSSPTSSTAAVVGDPQDDEMSQLAESRSKGKGKAPVLQDTTSGTAWPSKPSAPRTPSKAWSTTAEAGDDTERSPKLNAPRISSQAWSTTAEAGGDLGSSSDDSKGQELGPASKKKVVFEECPPGPILTPGTPRRGKVTKPTYPEGKTPTPDK